MTGARGRTAAFAIAAALCVAAAAIGLRSVRHAPAAQSYAGTPVSPPEPVADFVLRGRDGRPTHLLAGAPLEFLFFGYTHCPDECPLAMASLAHAYHSLDARAHTRTRVVFVTIDPARDTPRAVRRYVRGFDPQFVGLTGSAAELGRVERSYGVTVDRATKDIGHGDAIYAIDDRAREILIYPPDVPASDLASDAAKIAG